MNIVTEVSEWQSLRKSWANKSIGFVPTMGNLHAGHISLCEQSKAQNDVTVVSIFVNQTQFNEAKDYDTYPRTLEADKALLDAAQVDYVLMPSMQDMYPDHYQVQVTETTLSVELEGACRPGHFNGMLTVVMKLLNLVQPTRAYFGEKDYQQFLLVQKMAQALFLPTEIVPCATIRAEDGLALSSRNSRLSVAQRHRAVGFAQLMQSSLSAEVIADQLVGLGFKVDYIAEKWGRRLGAVWLDEVRLIDNVAIGVGE